MRDSGAGIPLAVGFRGIGIQRRITVTQMVGAHTAQLPDSDGHEALRLIDELI